jgi:hypothetical protein
MWRGNRVMGLVLFTWQRGMMGGKTEKVGLIIEGLLPSHIG